MFTDFYAGNIGVFIGLTVVISGGAAWLSGQALANNWKSFERTGIFYSLLLAAGCRFLVFALFGGPLLSIPGFLIDFAVIVTFAFVAFRMTKARKMVAQYPWLYERSGLFSWNEKKQPA